MFICDLSRFARINLEQEMKNVIITGASSGIGEATAIKFAQEGYTLAITGRRKDNLEKLADHLEKEYNSKVFTYAFDIQSADETEKNFGIMVKSLGAVDLLVNNAGLAAGLDEFHQSSLADWEQMIDTNIKGLLYISKLVSEKMAEQKSGHIINVGSISGYDVYPRGHVYCSTKFAVRAISEGMREDLIKYKVKVSSINPGMVETEFAKVRFKGSEAAAKKVYEGFTPLKGSDVAETIFFMATAPAHVNLSEVNILPSAQANGHYTHRLV